MNRAQLKPDRCYFERKSNQYFLSPDGVGCYWYDTYDDFVEAHGVPAKVHYVEVLTDW